MKKFLLIAFVSVLSLSAFANSGGYKINDSEVEAKLTKEVVVESNILISNEVTAPAGLDFAYQSEAGDKDPLVAILLDFFLGGFAIHRVYLGGSPGLIAGYFFTCGGIFGILPLGDLIVLAINYNDISKYVDNSKFIMW